MPRGEQEYYRIDWDKFSQKVIQDWQEQLKKKNIYDTGTLYRSFQYNFRVTNAMNQTLGRGAGLSEGAVTVPDKLAFSFPLYGIYVERGVGRGYTRGNTGDLLKFKGGRGRTRRWWYYNVFVRQRHRLGQLVAQQYGRAAAAQILTIEVKSISRQ